MFVNFVSNISVGILKLTLRGRRPCRFIFDYPITESTVKKIPLHRQFVRDGNETRLLLNGSVHPFWFLTLLKVDLERKKKQPTLYFLTHRLLSWCMLKIENVYFCTYYKPLVIFYFQHSEGKHDTRKSLAAKDVRACT